MQTLSFIGAMVLVFAANGFPAMGLLFAIPMMDKLSKADNNPLFLFVGIMAERTMQFQFHVMPWVYLGFGCMYAFWSRSLAIESVKYLYITAALSVAVMALTLILAGKLK